MLAAAQPFDGVLRKDANELDFFALRSLPNSKRLVRSLKVRKVNVRRDSSPDDALRTVIVGDVKHTVPVFDINRVLNVNLRFKVTPHIAHSLRPITPEHIGNERDKVNKGNTLTCVIDGCSPALRPTVKPFRLFNGVTNRPPNDNDDPSQVEAA
jgi:hypothetical protein